MDEIEKNRAELGNKEGNWRAPDVIEEKCLYNYVNDEATLSNIIFKSWTAFGVFAIILTIIGVVKSIIDEPKAMVGIIVIGIMSMLLIWFIFIKFGNYVLNNLRYDVRLLNEHRVSICTCVVISTHSRAKRKHRRNYYAKTRYLDSNDVVAKMIEADVRLSKSDYENMKSGDKIVLVCFDYSIKNKSIRAFLPETLISYL